MPLLSTRSRWRLRAVCLLLVFAAAAQLRVTLHHLPFAFQTVKHNFLLLTHHEKPPLRSRYLEQRLDDELARWNLTAPIKMALPPMYSDTPFGNAGFLTSFVNHGEVIFYNGPFPHPKMSITERIGGSSQIEPYSSDNRSSNTALLVSFSGHVWPYGYTAWYDLLVSGQTITLKTPHLIDRFGQRIDAIGVRVVHPLNRAELWSDATVIDLHHLSPVVWTFPTEGRLDTDEPGYTVNSVLDGAEVSWMPSLASLGAHPFGLFLLDQAVAPADQHPPPWWQIDERFRRAVVDGHPIDERRELLKQLARAFPTHPLLSHYKVIAELGGNGFDNAWLAAQQKACDATTWYLIAWTNVPWSRARMLPCVVNLDAEPVDLRTYVCESTVIAYRDRPEADAQLRNLATLAVQAGYLQNSPRAFNYAPNDFAWLWLRRRR